MKKSCKDGTPSLGRYVGGLRSLLWLDLGGEAGLVQEVRQSLACGSQRNLVGGNVGGTPSIFMQVYLVFLGHLTQWVIGGSN